MKRLLLVAAFSMALCGVAGAQAHHLKGGLGFHSSDAPIGVRWWLSEQKLAIDAGVGFGSSPATVDPDEKVNNWTIDAGLPWVMKSWEGCHVMFRPGIRYHSEQVDFDSDPSPTVVVFDTEDVTSFDIQGEIEAEVFLRDNVSVSAAHGLRFSSVDPGFGGDSSTSFSTTGNNFTTIGFHVYIFGAE